MQSRGLWVSVISHRLAKELDVHTEVLAMHCANADWQIREVHRG